VPIAATFRRPLRGADADLLVTPRRRKVDAGRESEAIAEGR
jgi:hypothetical protein